MASSIDFVDEETVVVDDVSDSDALVLQPVLELMLVSIILVEVIVVVVEARKAHFKVKGSVLIDLVVVAFPPVGLSSEKARFLGDSDPLLAFAVLAPDEKISDSWLSVGLPDDVRICPLTGNSVGSFC